MAQYTIITTREQEAGLTYSHEHYAEEGQDKAQFLQKRVSHSVLNSMFEDYKRSNAVALDKSIATIPASNEAKASQEIQAVIVANGGTVVPVGPPHNPLISVTTNGKSAESNNTSTTLPDNRGAIRSEDNG
jgi:hypothetical protein